MKLMRTVTVVLVVLLLSAALAAQDQLLAGGMLIPCTMSEPNFSLKTAEIGDPVVCYLPSLRNFGQPLFPPGSFLTGALMDGDKPGRLWGKGSLTILFDRLVLPNAVTVPVSMKIISIPKMKLSPDGRILGRGHAKRDTVGWMFLPPVQAMATLGRGPYPALKGHEQRLLLRVMVDSFIPAMNALRQSGYSYAPTAADKPNLRTGGDVILVKKDHSAVSVVDYWYEVPGYVNFASDNHTLGRIPLNQLDLRETARINSERGIEFRVER